MLQHTHQDVITCSINAVTHTCQSVITCNLDADMLTEETAYMPCCATGFHCLPLCLYPSGLLSETNPVNIEECSVVVLCRT